MKIVVLSDNKKTCESFESEHGLSVFIETENQRCLLDVGASDIFIRNAERLGVDIKSVDLLFISHGHADHLGGLLPFLELNKKATVILSKYVINQKFFSKRNGFHSIGIEMNINLYKDRFVYVESELQIDPEIRVFTTRSDTYPQPKANKTLFKDEGGGLVQDDFIHELIFTYGSEDLFVYSGCAHKGLLNILDAVSFKTGKNIATVVGGFHLLDSNDLWQFETSSEVDVIATVLKSKYPRTHFITGHCTGEKVYGNLKKHLGNQLDQFYSGYTSEIK